jgi:PAS domain S-box-containing protein
MTENGRVFLHAKAISQDPGGDGGMGEPVKQSQDTGKGNTSELACIDCTLPNSTTPREAEFIRLEALITTISARMVKASPENLDAEIIRSLQEIFQLLEINRGALLEVAEDSPIVKISHAWYDTGVEPISTEINLAELFPWVYQQLVGQGKPFVMTNIDELPPEAVVDRQTQLRLGTKSALSIPLAIGGRIHHIIAVHTLKKERSWPEIFIARLRLMGEIFVSALERRDIVRALQINQYRLNLAAASADAGLWELDLATGIFWLTDKTRELFDIPQEEVITLQRFLQKIHPDDRGSIIEVLDQLHDSLERQVEYRVPGQDGQIRWMISRGRVQQDDAKKGKRFMGVTLEITNRKQMEQKMQEQLQEISHLRELLERENTFLRSEVGLQDDRKFPLGTSSSMQMLMERIEQVANTDSTVLILGETGTGKELVAQTIHRLSERGKRLMVTVNCAALPAALVESELFGREKGAFTGALSRQVGRFELANGSTLLLDEIAEMPLETQAKLLRVLQEGRFERLGSPQSIKVDVRIIAATNRNLAEEVESGRFRRDLFYRLNVFPIHVPPLRERVEDIPQLTWEFVNEFGQRMGRKIRRIASCDMEALKAYSWPGNIRELRNAIEHALIVSKGDVLELSHLAPSLPHKSQLLTLRELEYQHIRETLKTTHGRVKGKDGAAELLGINPSTLYSRMRKLKINPVHF